MQAAAELKPLADAAAALIQADGPFLRAVADLRKQWFGELMTRSEMPEIMRLTAQLQALEAIPQQLAAYVSNYNVAVKRQSHG